MLADLLVVALAAAFVASLAERWIDHSLLRGGVALFVSILGAAAFDYSAGKGVFFATAAAFAAMIAILIGERLATPPPLVVDTRLR